MTLSFRSFVVVASLAAVSAYACAQDGPQKLPSITLSAGMHLIQAEVAQTPDQRSTGLMFRSTMGTNEGMLFAFEEPGQQCPTTQACRADRTRKPIELRIIHRLLPDTNPDNPKEGLLDHSRGHCQTGCFSGYQGR